MEHKTTIKTVKRRNCFDCIFADLFLITYAPEKANIIPLFTNHNCNGIVCFFMPKTCPVE